MIELYLAAAGVVIVVLIVAQIWVSRIRDASFKKQMQDATFQILGCLVLIGLVLASFQSFF